MTNCTDQTQDGAPGGTDSVDNAMVGQVLRVLVAMADHFTENRPGALLTSDALQVCTAAEVYNATGRSVLGSGAVLLSAVTDALPEAAPASTRGQYAAVLREEAAAYDGAEERVAKLHRECREDYQGAASARERARDQRAQDSARENADEELPAGGDR
ncbi:hypothetical protein [Streptomyces sp. NPDC102437]|uniref:hypothetical protein n=1 Tax=Streptomyces sp. NPDC102437 TaxID=3366175 RepID=UPI0037F8E926